MSQLAGQLGIDWRLLLSQAVNFFLLLLVLRIFVYKPLLKLLRDRREKIENGLMKAEEAGRRLEAAEEEHRRRLKDAEAAAVGILRKAETDAKGLEERLVAAARKKEADELAKIGAALRAKEEESRRAVEAEAVAFVKSVVAKTVELSPESVDDALVARAVKELKQAAS